MTFEHIIVPGAFTIRFLWSLGVENIVPRAFSHSFCPQNIFVALKIVAIFREFDFFRNKAKHAGRFHKKCWKKGEMRDFPHDCRMVDTYVKIICYVYCCNLVAVKLVSSS